MALIIITRKGMQLYPAIPLSEQHPHLMKGKSSGKLTITPEEPGHWIFEVKLNFPDKTQVFKISVAAKSSELTLPYTVWLLMAWPEIETIVMSRCPPQDIIVTAHSF